MIVWRAGRAPDEEWQRGDYKSDGPAPDLLLLSGEGGAEPFAERRLREGA